MNMGMALESLSLLAVFICSAIVPIVLLLILFSRLMRPKLPPESVALSSTIIDGTNRARPLGPWEAGMVASRWASPLLNIFTVESGVPLNPKMMRKALVMVSERYPLLRMRITKDSRFTESEKPNLVDFQVRGEVNADKWIPVAEQLSLSWFDMSCGPLWRAILLKETYDAEAEKYKNTLLISIHHVISDGQSFMVLFEQLLDYLSSLHKGEKVTVESLPLRPPLSHLLRHSIKSPSIWHEMLARTMIFVMRLKPKAAPNLYTSIFPPVILSNPFVNVCTSIVPRLLPADDTRRLAKGCKEHAGCTVHGAITAATHMAMAKILQRGNKTVKCPVSLKTHFNVGLRKQCHPKIQENEFGFFISGVAMQCSVPERDFWAFAVECTKKVHKAIADGEHHKFLRMTPYSRFFPRDERPATGGRRDILFYISNLGRFQLGEGKGWPFQPVARYGVSADHTAGAVFGNTLVTINGRLSWGVYYSTNVTTKQQAEEFIDLAIAIVKNAISEVK